MPEFAIGLIVNFSVISFPLPCSSVLSDELICAVKKQRDKSCVVFWRGSEWVLHGPLVHFGYFGNGIQC